MQASFTTATATKRASFALSVIASCAIALGVGAPTASAGGGCPNADLVPAGPQDVPAVEAATRCLINVQRRRHGLRSLKFNADLQKSSDWQAQDMIDHAYFDHSRPGGPGFAGRITRFGYAASANGYMLGENIAWATSDAASPREMVSMWMHSPPHRQNILRRGFKDQAISAVYSAGGVGGDYADSNGPFVVYVNQFGTRY